MGRLHDNRFWTGSFAFFMALTLPACAMFETKQEDPKVVALQREVRQVEKSSAFNQKAVEDIHERLDALEDQIGEMNKSMVAQAKRLQTLSETSKSQKPVAKGPEGQTKTLQSTKKPSVKKKTAASNLNMQKAYNKAYTAYLEQRHDEALALFKEFHKNHPKHDLADNAQYWVGEIYYDIEDYPNAILAFKEVVTKYGNQSKAPDALLKIGYSYIALDDPNNARVFLKRVIKNYPFSESEAKARAKLKELENL